MFRNSAHIYDLLYGDDRYESEAVDLVALIDQHAPGAKTLLDVACGTGGHLRHLKGRFEVTGVDLDFGMLEQARARDSSIEFVEGDMRSFNLDRTFDVVLCLFSSVGYLLSREDLRAAVANLGRHLSDTGVLIVDGWVRPDEWKGDISLHAMMSEDDNTNVARVSRSIREGNRTVLNMEYLIATRDAIEHVVDRHELRLHTPEEYGAAFAGAGLKTVVIDSPWQGRDRYVAHHS
jgi:SAM-dependent methyltransferase